MNETLTPIGSNSLAAEIGKRDPCECLEQEAMLNVLRTAATLSDPMNRLLKNHGLSMAKLNILRILCGEGQPTACSLIKQRMIAMVPDVSRIIDRLERDGLVNRIRSTRDRRVVHVQITEAGRKLLDRVNPEVVRQHRQLLQSLSKEELRVLNDLLVRAREAANRSTRDATLNQRE